VERARTQGPLAPEKARAEITRQLTAWQAALYTAITREGFRPASYGPYRAPESAASWFSCWSRTNADAVPKPRATVNTTNCRTKTWLFVANDLSTGQIEFSHSYVRSLSLNVFQFSAFLSEQYRSSWIGGFAPKRLTRQKCHEDFVATGTGADRPLLRVVVCARAYREFEGLYDVTVAGVTATLFEVDVLGERATKAPLPHDPKGEAVGERPALVHVLQEMALRRVESFRVRPAADSKTLSKKCRNSSKEKVFTNGAVDLA
jgi:hypothetical protein